jgi:hypothetical protein
MYGFQNLASQQDQRFWVFQAGLSVYQEPSSFNRHTVWTKPPGISFIHIICVGGASGGGGAPIRNAGASVGGGGGGASGTITSTFLPAYLVPDTLYISVGPGGNGGAGGPSTVAAAGNPGFPSWVSFWPEPNISFVPGYTLCFANQAFIGGGAGALGALGTGGTAPAAVSATSLRYSQVGLRNYLPGQVGANGGAGAGGSITALYRTTGGAGGGGNNASGVVGVGGSVSAAGEYINPIASSPSGSDGPRIQDLIKFIAAGGTGGSGAVSISGSRGGAGGFGSGGGGGSVGAGGGGAGGDGGTGLVIITCG